MPAASARLAGQVVAAVHVLRAEDLLKPPGVAETLDWTRALIALGVDALDAEVATVTLGTVLKYREDLQRASRLDVGALLDQAIAQA